MNETWILLDKAWGLRERGLISWEDYEEICEELCKPPTRWQRFRWWLYPAYHWLQRAYDIIMQ